MNKEKTKLTRYGVAYDLKASPFKQLMKYEFQEVEFVFSSELYRGKFVEQLEANRTKLSESLSNRFGYEIKNNALYDLILYTKIEKRGFLIKVNEVPVECQEYITLDGQMLTIKN